MPELKKELIRLKEGESHTAGPEDVVITEEHTISDILRYAVSCADIEEVKSIITDIERNSN